MKRLILITGLLVALLGLIRFVDAEEVVVGYGSNAAGEIHLIDLGSTPATSLSSFTPIIDNVNIPPLLGLAIDPTGTTLYGSTQNGLLYSMDIVPGQPTLTLTNITLVGNMGLGTVEAMDFSPDGLELWVTDFVNFPPDITIYKINNFDTIDPISATPVQTLHPGINGVVRAMAANPVDPIEDVWIANDKFPSMDFQSVDTDPDKAPPEINVTPLGFLDDDPSAPFFIPRPEIRGMDRAAIDGVLYGLDNVGGVYKIRDQLDPINHPDELLGHLTFKGDTGGHVWLALAVATATEGTGSQHNAVGELKIDKEQGQRVAKSMHFETYNTDPELLNIWNSLFGVEPETSLDDTVILQGPNRIVTWEAGILEMSGLMKIKVKTDKHDPTIKNIKIAKTGKDEVPTLFVSGTGGVDPNLADGGWHGVKIKNLNNVTVTIDGGAPITGFLKKLEVKLDKDGTTAFPLVKNFKLKIKGATSLDDVKKGYISSVVVVVPQTVVTANAEAEYEEEIKGKPEVLLGHTEAEFEREYCAETEGVDISGLNDGNNNKLKKRKGPCVIKDVVVVP